MTANQKKSYLSYFNKLVDQFNNTYHRSIGENLVDSDFFALTEESESSHEAPKFKVSDLVKISKYRNSFRKGYTKNWSREIFVVDSVLKTNPCAYKVKDLRRKIIGNFYDRKIVTE